MTKFHGPGGFVHNITPEQQETLNTFKEQIAKQVTKYTCTPGKWFQLDDDRVLLKFLRARNFDVKEALVMVHYHVDMRANWDVDNMKLTDEDLAEALKMGVWRLAGTSKQGHPIQQILVGHFHPRDVKTMEQYWRTVIFQRELSLLAMQEEDWKVETTMVLFDMEGWSLFEQGAPSAMKYTKILVDVAQNAYPECLEKAIIFNAPWMFRTAWAIIHPWLDPQTAGRVIFVSDPKELHALIDPSVLEEKYGGTRKEPWPTYLLP
jgi:hypothetical protein